MQARSTSELKIDDLGSELRFTLSHERGWIYFALIVGAFIGLGLCAFLEQSVWLGCICCLLMAVPLIMNWMRGSTTVFRISEQRVVATGNLYRWSASDVNISASDVMSIGWNSGGEDASNGIYVWHGWGGMRSTCVLPGISCDKAQPILDAIKLRFPQYAIKDVRPFSVSFGIGS
jgi:hypothetical protein